jgi:hypothetical protein
LGTKNQSQEVLRRLIYHTMHIFRRKQEPATEIDLVAVADSGYNGTEKGTATELERSAVQHQHHVDPALEAHVVRKMDLRLVPLVMSLCKDMYRYGRNQY